MVSYITMSWGQCMVRTASIVTLAPHMRYIYFLDNIPFYSMTFPPPGNANFKVVYIVDILFSFLFFGHFLI